MENTTMNVMETAVETAAQDIQVAVAPDPVVQYVDREVRVEVPDPHAKKIGRIQGAVVGSVASLGVGILVNRGIKKFKANREKKKAEEAAFEEFKKAREEEEALKAAQNTEAPAQETPQAETPAQQNGNGGKK